jgi:hypothetical protein
MRSVFRPGTDTWIASDSPSSHFSGVFEDDGVTGYFYAYDRRPGVGILDAVHIYNAANVVDADRDSVAEVRWSSDGLKAGLFINDYLHALIDFVARVAYCRSGFPPPGGAWAGPPRVPWRDDLADLLK